MSAHLSIERRPADCVARHAIPNPLVICDAMSSLVVRVAAGDASAFHRIYELRASRLYTIALRITGQEALAHDAVHDAFLQLWCNAHRFDPARGTAEAWLRGLTRYRALDIVRDRMHETPDNHLRELADEALDPLTRFTQESDAAALHACVNRLSAERRQIVILAFMHGLSHAEVAGRLRIPIGTVKSSIRRALQTLRRHLADTDESGSAPATGCQAAGIANTARRTDALASFVFP